ncbi:MAG: aminoacetone oxidase family FAD-binding enzyme [Mycoplasmatales bacterium]
MEQYDVIVIGSGPCGLMSSYTIKNKKVLLLDANRFLGGKIRVSGGGRCNVTNNKNIASFIENIPKNNKFLYSTFNHYAPQALIDFFNTNQVPVKEEDNNRMLIKSNNAKDVINFFEQKITNHPQKTIKLNYLVQKIEYLKQHYIIDQKFSAKYLVLAMGGATYPQISQGFTSYDLVTSLNHSITELLPAEAPLVINEPLIENKTLQGISLINCQGELYVNKKKKKVITKDILFTHFGLSGPLALNLSFYAKEALMKDKIVTIKLLPVNPPKKLVPFLDENNSLTLRISDIKGFKTAFVTNGGVNLKEINPTTLESKINTNLFLVGELLDINCFTGGYNIGTYLCMGKLIGDVINER